MRPFFDVQGQQLDLGRCLGRGGEGAVYSLPLRPRSVAKIYTESPDEQAFLKLGAMVVLGTPALLSVAAWPEGLLLDRRGGRVAGFLMPRVEGHQPIHSLYGPRDRAAVFPDANWAFLIRAARNLAATFDTVHEHHHVLGDVNQGNVVVSGNATVRLIDCDSFQISHEGHVYPCRVGVPLFTPPELQGQRLGELVRTADHDRFGLAVLVFHLLFMGRHPCGGRHPDRPLNVEAAAREGIFAFGREAARQGWQPPPFSLKLAEVPSALADLFERALGREAVAGRPRPTAAEWVAALDLLERSTVSCSEDPRHVHGSAEGACPWCRIEKLGGPSFFLPPPAGGPGAFDLAAFGRALEAVRSPGPAALARPRPVPVPAQTSGIPSPRRWAASIVAGGRGLMSDTLVKLDVAVGDRRFPGSSLLRRGRLRRQQQEHTVQADARHLRALEVRWELECSDAAFARKRRKLEAVKTGVEALPALEQREQARLAERFREAAFLRHLHRFPLVSANLPGLEAATLRRLAAHGVTSAADLSSPALLAIPGIDLDLVRTLVHYRELVERSFARCSSQGPPGKDLRALEDYQARRRKRVEEELRTGLKELMALRRQTFAQRVELSKEIEEARTRLAEARAGRRIVPLPAVSAGPRPFPNLVALQARAPVAQSQPSTSSEPISWQSGLMLAFVLQAVLRNCSPSPSNFPPPDNRAPKQTARPAPAPRVESDLTAGLGARARRAIELTRAGRYDEATASYQELVKEYPADLRLYRNLGYVCIQRQDWPGAEKAYLKALELKPNHPEASVGLAFVYEQWHQPMKALDVLSRAAAANPGHARVQLRLGIFNRRAGALEPAAAAFQKALAADPSLADAHYLLATLLARQARAGISPTVSADKTREAVWHLEKYLSMSPGDARNAAPARGLLAYLKRDVEK